VINFRQPDTFRFFQVSIAAWLPLSRLPSSFPGRTCLNSQSFASISNISAKPMKVLPTGQPRNLLQHCISTTLHQHCTSTARQQRKHTMLHPLEYINKTITALLSTTTLTIPQNSTDSTNANHNAFHQLHKPHLPFPLSLPPANNLAHNPPHPLPRLQLGEFFFVEGSFCSQQMKKRINNQWRICFRWENGNAYDVEILDCHN